MLGVRFAPKSGRKADILDRQLWAIGDIALEGLFATVPVNNVHRAFRRAFPKYFDVTPAVADDAFFQALMELGMTWGDLLSQHTDWRRRALVWFWLLVIVLSGPAQAQSLRVTGDWEQFVLSESTGAWRSLGLFRVLESGGVYSMEPITQAPATNAINTKGLFNVRFSGSEWSFDSDWGEVGVAEFRMQRGAPGVYHGWSHLRGEQRDLNMWLLVR